MFASCKKPTQEKSCNNDNCYGKHDIFLDIAGRNMVIKKDTTYIFVSNTNDTMKLKFRKTFTEFYRQHYSCECVEKSTDITGEYLHGIFVFQNKNLAVRYSASIVYPNRTAFDIELSDTNKLINSTISNYITTGTTNYLFRTNSIFDKQNNFDSININSKYYYNVINTYDATNSDTNITACYYSKYFGLISFKYNSLVYNIIP
jgi:hypothetical protein